MGAGGRLDRLVTLQRKTVTVDNFGAESVTWADHLTAWARRRDQSDGEAYGAGQVQSTRLTRFLIRWSVLASSLTAEDRLTSGADTYQIMHVKEAIGEGRRRYLEITAGITDG